jgi:hypothetical protein
VDEYRSEESPVVGIRLLLQVHHIHRKVRDPFKPVFTDDEVDLDAHRPFAGEEAVQSVEGYPCLRRTRAFSLPVQHPARGEVGLKQFSVASWERAS